MTGSSGVSSTLRSIDSIIHVPEYWIARLRACEEYRPHPEELAKQASRRMDTPHGPAAILRDARQGALLRMRSQPLSRATTAEAGSIFKRPIPNATSRPRSA